MRTNDNNYAVNNFLNSVYLSYEGIRRLSPSTNGNFELISLEPFHEAICELLLCATVTGLEEYLKVRLKKEILRSKESMRLYALRYHKDYHRYVLDNFVFSNTLEPSEKDKQKIIRSLDFIVFHRLGVVNNYFKAMLDSFNIEEVDQYEYITELIKTRNRIIHNGKRDRKGEININLSDINQALVNVGRFIKSVEVFFIQNDHGRVIISPDE